MYLQMLEPSHILCRGQDEKATEAADTERKVAYLHEQIEVHAAQRD